MSLRHKILVVDDEREIRELLGELLAKKYDVVLASDGLEAVEKAKQALPSVIVLDVMMPQMDGISTCQALRETEKTRHIPVIMLTAVKDSSDRVRAFKAGADDYIAKPVMADELFARVESKLRRLEENGQNKSINSSPIIECGNLTMNTESLEVRIRGKEITMTLLEFNLLRFLIENKGKLCSRQQIMETVWNEPGASTKVRLLDPHILAIRKKLDGFDHTLCTVYGGGYILKGPSVSQSA